MRTIFIFVLVLLSAPVLRAGNDMQPQLDDTVEIILVEASELYESQSAKPSPLLMKMLSLKKKGKKLNAALLAFPFPCGIVGLHRIYLGTAPYIPVVYIATFGGAFGILPFIDFCVLMLDKDVEPYIRNEKVFMWSR